MCGITTKHVALLMRHIFCNCDSDIWWYFHFYWKQQYSTVACVVYSNFITVVNQRPVDIVVLVLFLCDTGESVLQFPIFDSVSNNKTVFLIVHKSIDHSKSTFLQQLIFIDGMRNENIIGFSVFIVNLSVMHFAFALFISSICFLLLHVRSTMRNINTVPLCLKC